MSSQVTVQYPYTDKLGYRWVNSSTFTSKETGNCFFCNEPTNRVDINFEAYYCGEDDAAIEQELSKLE